MLKVKFENLTESSVEIAVEPWAYAATVQPMEAVSIEYEQSEYELEVSMMRRGMYVSASIRIRL